MKMNGIVVYCIIICCFQLFGMTNDTMAEEYYLIPEGRGFKVYNFVDQKFKLYQEIFFGDILNCEFPNYNMSTGDVYFEGEDYSSMREKTYIYNFNMKNPAEVKVVLEGRLPALSTDGKMLVYYQYPNKLWLYNFQNKQAYKIADDWGRAAVWISSNRLLYCDNNHKLILFDVIEGKQETGHEKVIPKALSPDGKTVLCNSYDGRKILLYSIDANKIETLKDTKYYTVGSYTWRPDGKSFFFTRQTWSKQLRLSEAHEFFLFSLEKKAEEHLSSDRCFSGVFIGDRFNKK